MPNQMPEPAPYDAGAYRGLVMVKTPEQTDAYMQAQDQAETQQPITPVITALAGHIDSAWMANKTAKGPIELVLLQCMRQRAGEYDPDVLAQLQQQGEKNPIYMMVTDIKCRAAIAWIKDSMIPQGEVPFRLDPTPIPTLPPEMVDIAKAKVTAGLQQRMMETGIDARQIDRTMMMEVADQVKGELRKQVEEMARKDADQLGREINDELVEGSWYESLNDLIDDFVTYPTAFMRGPVPRRKRVIEWVKQGGKSIPTITMKIVKDYERVSPFDIYPSSGAKTLNDGNLIQHIRYSPSDLQEMIGVEGYDEEAIRQVLDLHAQGGLKEWLSIDSARALLENRHNETGDIEPRIDGLRFMGDVQGKMLLAWGMSPEQVPDPDIMYPVTCVKIGPHVISARINQNPLKHRNYYCASFIKVVGSLWGRSVPMVMKDIQRICNGAARSIVTNMSMASGPQVWINKSRMDPTMDAAKMWPWKIWAFNDGEIKSRTDIPMDFFMPQVIVNELLAIYKHFYDQAGEVTGIPAYIHASDKVSGAGSTMGGLSMLMNASAKGLRSSVINIDKGVIVPSVKEHWMGIMINDPERAIGDANVVARASDYLMQAEQLQMATAEALGLTNNPTDMEIIGLEGRGEMLREYLKRLKIPVDRIVPDRDSLINKTAENKLTGLIQRLAKALGMDPQQLMTLAQGGQPALPAPQGA